MDAELKADWVEALTSGEYKQGTGTLRTEDDKFCCIGVLCDLLVKRELGQWAGNDYEASYRFEPTADIFSSKRIVDGALSVTLLKDLRFAAGDGSVAASAIQDTLIQMNDIEKADFNTIAEVVKNLATEDE